MIWVLRLLFLILCCWGNAQNLVKNPSFENYIDCPNALGTFGTQVKNWSTPTNGSTDYFNMCSKVMSAPENFNGVQHPKSGEAYAGFYFYAPGDYREYIQAELTQTLQKDQKYEMEFYVSLAEGSDFSVKDFGVILSYRPLDIDTKKELSRGRLYATKGNRFQVLEINHSNFHEDKSVWLKINTSFIAKGFENYLVIGNLRNNKTTRKVQTKRKETKRGAYYYTDKVALISANSKNRIEQKMDTDTLYVLKNVHFDFDKFVLTDKALEELQALKGYLMNHPNLNLEIHGHTDNVGHEQYNQILSENRAKAITTYFQSQGVLADRIFFLGHGSKKPIASNATQKGRSKNRRVEFRFRRMN